MLNCVQRYQLAHGASSCWSTDLEPAIRRSVLKANVLVASCYEQGTMMHLVWRGLQEQQQGVYRT